MEKIVLQDGPERMGSVWRKHFARKTNKAGHAGGGSCANVAGGDDGAGTGGEGRSDLDSHVVLRPLGRQDNEDLDRLIVAADTGLLWLTCLLFDSEWFWDDLMDSWTDYLMSPFEDYPLDDAQ